MVEYYVDILVSFVARVAEVGAAVVILAGVVQALHQWVRHWREGGLQPEDRTSLGWSIVLGLEFLVAADVLVTAIAPTWNRLGQVAAVILIRLILAYFLEAELGRLADSRAEPRA